MTRPFAPLLPLALVAAVCSTTSSGEVPPSIEAEIDAMQAEGAANRERMADPQRLLLDLDRSIDKYVEYVHKSGSMRMDANVEKMGDFLFQQAVLHFDTLVFECNRSEFPRNRAIAAAALGFSAKDEALEPLLNAATADEEEVVANAIFGLGILAHDPTPPGVIADAIHNPDYSDELRAGAAWSLHEIQIKATDPEPIVRIWRSVLSAPIDTFPAGVCTQAIRGIGLTRNPEYRELVERFVSHPTPMVRWATAIALGRFGSADAVPALLSLLGPAEQNQNVRFSARKALEALAGGVDVGYDVEAWRKTFERGP